MITFSRLGTKGNLGNQLFQIASVVGLAKIHQQEYCFPDWSYSAFFQHKLPSCNSHPDFTLIKEKEFNYHEWNLFSGNFDINGWLQTEKYFDVSKTRELFSFEKGFEKMVLDKYLSLFDKKTILISVRRGDFVNHPSYFQLGYNYYLQALIQNFPDYKERTLIFTSDDISYCKYHYSFLDNAVFLENVPPMEQMVIGINCDDYIISNSTFSWWIAWLGEKGTTRIYRPIKNLAGEFGAENDDRDYFPERWIAFDEKRYPLPGKYFLLWLKGEAYNLKTNSVHGYGVYLKKTKNLVKKLIGRK
ncbi:MAG: alpha-1,2-fucosyltransferase [Flavobacterium sp.]